MKLKRRSPERGIPARQRAMRTPIGAVIAAPAGAAAPPLHWNNPPAGTKSFAHILAEARLTGMYHRPR